MSDRVQSSIYQTLFSKLAKSGCRRARSQVAWTTCSYVPVELIESFGIRCTRLTAAGDVDSETTGGNRLGTEACAWCKSLAGTFADISTSNGISALIGCTSCDQMRRTAEEIASGSFHMVNMPATVSDNAYGLYRSELMRLVGFLEGFSGRKFSPVLLGERIAALNRLRRGLSAMRDRVTSASMLALVLFAWQEGIDSAQSALARFSNVEHRNSTDGKRILLAGGPLSHGDLEFLELLDSYGAFVAADLTCTGERFYDFEVPEDGDPLESLTRAYFNRPECIWRRPNNGFYDLLNATIAKRQISGIIWRAPRFCDMWNAEIGRVRSVTDLPVLHLDTTYADLASPRVITRIEAFVESL